jgi:hypothetical protein
VNVYGTLVENKMRRFKGECSHFRFNMCFIYAHDGASAKALTHMKRITGQGGLQFGWFTLGRCKCPGRAAIRLVYIK